MHRYLLIVLALSLTGCAFYEKNFDSEIVLEGTNYRGAIYDEGQFYINDEPSITMHMGCSRRTQLGATVFPLIPFPVLNEAEPHESIASQQFSLTLSHLKNDDIDLSTLKIDVDISGTVHPLRFTQKEEPPYSRRLRYEYAADLRCGEIDDGVLRIHLESDKVRVYGVQFEEGVNREVAYHTDFVT